MTQSTKSRVRPRAHVQKPTHEDVAFHTNPQGDLLGTADSAALKGQKVGSETPKTRARPRKRKAKPSIRVVAPHESLQSRPLKKHVAAIHTDGHLSLLQRKLSNVLLLNAYDQLLTQTEHEIDEKTLCVMLGYDSNDRAPLKTALKALASIHAEWNILGDNQQEVEWGVSSLLSHAVLSKGRCRYGYSPALAVKLYNPHIYASFNMSVQRKFRSGHALALYENCYRFKKTGSTGWWTLETFRRLMGVNESDYYRQFKHLNAKIIKPTVREINRVSDIEITPEFKRKGRSIVELRFLIKANAQIPLLDVGDDDGVRATTVYQRLAAAGIGPKLSEAWIRQHGEDYVSAKLDLVETKAKSGKVVSVAGFLKAAVTDDYKDAPKAKAKTGSGPSAEARARREAKARDAAKADALAKEQEKQARLARVEAALAWFEAQTPDAKDAILAKFLPTLDKPFLRADYKRGGLKAPAVAARFSAFVDLPDPD